MKKDKILFVTIKNEYGAKREAIAEGTVKNGQIIDFNVH